MKKIIYLIHGFADWNGKLTTDLFCPYFEALGWKVREWDYGFTLLPELLHNKKEATKLAGEILSLLPDWIVVALAHSNGTRITQLATFQGALFHKMAWLSPALDRGATVAHGVGKVLVYHSPLDVPVRIARFLPFHPWGDMGAVGAQNTQAAISGCNRLCHCRNL